VGFIMTADQPLPFTPATPARRWLVTLSDGTTRTVEAGALVLVLPVGAAAAYAPGQWHRIEQEATP